jgi:hypothetical protein
MLDMSCHEKAKIEIYTHKLTELIFVLLFQYVQWEVQYCILKPRTGSLVTAFQAMNSQVLILVSFAL